MNSRKAISISPVETCADDLCLAHHYADEATKNMPAAISYAKKGLLYTDDGRIPDAECFRQAMGLSRDETCCSPEYVTFLAATGRFDEAIACSVEAIARDVERRSHSINLGQIYYIAGRLVEAKEQLERAEREYPDAWVAAALQGLIAITERRFSAAQRHFDRSRGLPRQGRL
jgi:tetratricopeptide (TPR) repeat protein